MSRFAKTTFPTTGDNGKVAVYNQGADRWDLGHGAVTNVRLAGGLVGNGTTNDAVALQAVIDASSVGDTLVFDRMFGVGATIRFKSERMYLGSIGTSVGLKMTNGANLDYLACDENWYNNGTTSGNPVKFMGLKFDGNKTNQTAGLGIGLVLMNYWSECWGCYFTDCRGHGHMVTTQNRAGTTISNVVSEPRYYMCHFRENGGGAFGNGGDNFHQNDPSFVKLADGWITDCTFSGSGRHGIYLQSGQGWMLKGNHLYSSAISGIYIERAYATNVTANYVEGWGFAVATSADKVGIFLNFATGPWVSVISSNTVTGPTPLSVGSVRGIQYYGVSGATTQVAVTGNSLYGLPDGDVGMWIESQGGGGTVLCSSLISNAVSGFATPLVTNAAVDYQSFPAGGSWAAATGVATRTTFATASVTLPQLAERVKALIDDLYTTKGLLD